MATRASMDDNVESADVNNAVDHLYEIAQFYKPYGSRADIIDEVVSILRDMDAKRLAAHEALEAETITCSGLRHEVATFPDVLKAEIAAATESARQSNSAQLKQLQERLGSINEDDSNCCRRNEVLQLHNEVLSTEEKTLSVRYNDLMKRLNKTMLEKSNMRIVLNETRSNLNTTQQQVTSTENETVQLDQAMIRERKSFHEEKESLSASLHTVTAKCEEQSKSDMHLKKDLLSLESKAVEIELEAEEKRNECRKLEARIKRLNARSVEVQNQIEEGETEAKRLNDEQKELTKKMEEMIESYASKKEEMITKTEQYVKEISLCSAEAKKLTSSRKALRKEHKKAQDDTNAQKLTLANIQENVDTVKRTLLFNAKEASRLVGTNQELELGSHQLQESHKVTKAVMKEKIIKLKDQLAKERSLRQEVMDELLELQKVKEKEQVEQTRSIKEANTEIKKQKYHQDRMSQKTSLLHKDIEECEQQTCQLKEALKMAKRRLDRLISSLTDQKSGLQAMIQSQQSVITETEKEYKLVEPKLKQFEDEYKEVSNQYEDKKKDIIAIKNKQTSLEERIARAKKTLSKMHIPQEQLRMDILRSRAYTRQHIREHSIDVDQLERLVLSTVRKLNVVQKENERLKKITELLKKETAYLAGITSSKEQLETGAMAKLTQCRESLQQVWSEDTTMDEIFARKDHLVLEEMNLLKEASKNRQNMLQQIQKRLDDELHTLTKFVEALTS